MITDKEFELLKRKVKRDRGIDLSYYKDSFVKRRVLFRMNKTGMAASKYVISLDEKEYPELFQALSINVSDFFRDSPVFSVFSDDILPNLVHYKEEIKRKTIRIWSAGCSFGEEPYTIAIILKEFFGEKNDFSISIIATDVDKVALERAKLGIYPKERVKNVPEELLKKYFYTDGEWYEVKEEIKCMVKFKSHDLIHDEPHNYFEVIFCRNVVIYFSRELQEKLFEHFYNALQKYGFLILGKTEGISGTAREKFAVVNMAERIYRKE